MANSRRRERELARRRYERRRMREEQLRARRRRRNTIGGAIVATLAVIGAIVGLAVGLSGGGSSKVDASKNPSSTPTPSASATPPPAAPKKCATIKPDPPAKGEPTIPQVKGKAPTKLVVKDIKQGHGTPAKSGDKLTVNYVGVSCSTGKVFDASYPRHQTFPFTLGQGSVIKGWDKGLVGMRAGGQRELIIPASEGYGAAGSGSTIKPNETLIFVVDLVKIG